MSSRKKGAPADTEAVVGDHTVSGAWAVGRGELEVVAPIKISSLAFRAAEAVRRQARARQVTVDIVGGEDALVAGEQESLESVLRNLLENAIRFSKHGGRVVLSYGVEDGSAVMTVADGGPGVPVELQEHIFEARNRGGRGDSTGLGLAFCRKVARAHGGDVSLQNRPVAGALFSVTLPRVGS